jgi:hypothetical protein
MLLKEMTNENAAVVSKDSLLKYLAGDYLKLVHESSFGEVLITAGAGDISQLVQSIKEIILDSE